MLQLWKAVTFLLRNPTVLTICKSAAAEITISHPDARRQQQPDPNAIIALAEVLNLTHGLRLGIYELAELNRWLLQPNSDASMADYADGLDLSAHTSDAFDEAVGMLLLDGEARMAVAASSTPGEILRDRQFAVTDAEGIHLRDKLQSGTQSATAADDFLTLAWGGGSCLSRLVSYPQYVHPNH